MCVPMFADGSVCISLVHLLIYDIHFFVCAHMLAVATRIRVCAFASAYEYALCICTRRSTMHACLYMFRVEEYTGE